MATGRKCGAYPGDGTPPSPTGMAELMRSAVRRAESKYRIDNPQQRRKMITNVAATLIEYGYDPTIEFLRVMQRDDAEISDRERTAFNLAILEYVAPKLARKEVEMKADIITATSEEDLNRELAKLAAQLGIELPAPESTPESPVRREPGRRGPGRPRKVKPTPLLSEFDAFLLAEDDDD